MGNDSALGSGTLTMTTGTTLGFSTAGLSIQNAIAFAGGDPTVDTSGGSETLGGVISGPGPLTVVGGNTLTLTGTNTYANGTNLNSGTIAVGNNSALGASSGTLAMAAGTTLSFTGAGFSIENPISLAAGTATVDTSNGSAQLNGVISGNGGLTTAGANTLILTSNEAYTGATNILAGTLALSGPGASISASSEVTVASGATFDISGVEIATVEPRFAVSLLASTVVSSLSGAGTTILGGNRLVIDLNNTSSTYSGVIQDGGGIVSGTGGSLLVTGNGTLTLSGANTYTGSTTVASGTLALAGMGSIANSNGVNLSASGATFDISGTAAGATVQSLTGGVGTSVSLGNQALTVNVACGCNNYSFAGTITDGGISGGIGGSLVKNGLGPSR